MHRILVSILLADESIEKIKLNPELQRREMEYVKQWQQEGILEHFFITASKRGAFLIFKDVDEVATRKLIQGLPYYPFMATVEYVSLDKHF